MKRPLTPEDIVSDAEMLRVHGNANFGKMDPRLVINEGVCKVACGWSLGSTMDGIVIAHGLANRRSDPYVPPYLTPKGRRYLFAALRHASVDWRIGEERGLPA